MGPAILFNPDMGDEGDFLLAEESEIDESGIDVAIVVGNDDGISFEAVVFFALFLHQKKRPRKSADDEEKKKPGDGLHKKKEKNARRVFLFRLELLVAENDVDDGIDRVR